MSQAARLRNAPNVHTPKGSAAHHKKAGEDGAAGSAAPASGASGLKKTRRRLSVMSDNKLIEGVEGLSISDDKVSAGAPAAAAAAAAAASAAAPDSDQAFIVSTYAGFSKKGFAPYNTKKKNQDALVMAEDPNTHSLLLAVMDGHGEAGDHVAQFVKRDLATNMFAHPEFATNIENAMRDVIGDIEARLLRDTSIDTEFSGTTFVAGVIRDNTITVGNIGDSRCTVAYRDDDGNIIAEAISLDHKPDLPDEHARITEAGGRVFAVEYDDGIDGPPRVWLGHMDVPGLAMSRSVGDTIAHTAGVSSEPEFFVRQLDASRDCLLILATDGLWEFMTDQEVVDMTAATTEPRIAVDALITEANDRWMKEEQVIDDTTVCVAFLGDFPALPGSSDGQAAAPAASEAK